MRLRLLVLLAAICGGALGGVLALRMTRGGAAPGEQAQPPAWARRSYYLRELRGGGVEIDAMTPLLLTGRPAERVPPSCPERLVVRAGDRGYADTVLPYVEAVAPLQFEKAAATGLAKEVLHVLRREWRVLRSLASGPVGTPPLRVLIKHYPRQDLPGRCFTIQTTFYDVPDMYLDGGMMRRYAPRAAEGPVIRGRILEIYRTYQTRGTAEPRLVEALVEVHVPVRVIPERLPPTILLHFPSKDGHPGIDRDFGAHMLPYGGGERRGLVWIDRSAGLGRPAPWDRAYRILVSAPGAAPVVTAEPLSPALVKALLAYAGKA